MAGHGNKTSRQCQAQRAPTRSRPLETLPARVCAVSLSGEECRGHAPLAGDDASRARSNAWFSGHAKGRVLAALDRGSGQGRLRAPRDPDPYRARYSYAVLSAHTETRIQAVAGGARVSRPRLWRERHRRSLGERRGTKRPRRVSQGFRRRAVPPRVCGGGAGDFVLRRKADGFFLLEQGTRTRRTYHVRAQRLARLSSRRFRHWPANLEIGRAHG